MIGEGDKMSQLELNTTALQELLDDVNALPDGEGGGGGNTEITLQEKSVTPTKSAQEVVADSGFDGLSKVNVGAIPDEYIVPSGTKSITTNGTHDVTANASVNVNVPIPEGYLKPSGTLNITENGEYDVTEKANVVVSVPDKSEDLDAVIAEQAELIEELSAALDNKAGGGGTTGENKLAKMVSGEGEFSLSAEDLAGIDSIRSNAFYWCANLKSIVVPSGVKSIPYNAFYCCEALSSVDLPSGLIDIADSAFRQCTSLRNIAFPSSVTSIGGQAFYAGHSSAVYDFSKHTSIPTIQVTTFIGSGIQIRVPSALYDQWISATNWARLANNIVAV